MFVKDVKVLKKLNLDALYGKAITIVMPDGEEVTYVGEMIASSASTTRYFAYFAVAASAKPINAFLTFSAAGHEAASCRLASHTGSL